MNSEAQYFTLDESQPGAIRPEILAKKIADVRRLKLPELAQYVAAHPRAIEALWFIQWKSMQPGGLAKFATELIAFIGDRLGTECTRKFGRRKYTRAECLKVWEEFPPDKRGDLEDCEEVDLTGGCDDENPHTRERRAQEHRREIERRLVERNEPFFRELIVETANDEFGFLFEKLCVGDSEKVSFVRWYCPDLLAEIIAYMDRHAEQMRPRLARTVVAEKVFDALDYAHSERVMVRIEGESRFGKSEAIETYAAMWPGRTRVIRTPSSNSERDLIRAVAEAFGIHQTFGTRGETMKDKVEFVIRFSGLMLCFDEGAFLLPSSFSATTPPARLNWIRSAIIDRKVPCVIVATPQSYNGALNRFVKKTGYTIEQFLGREALRVPLPNELPHEDLLAVARVHFPEADEDLLGLIAAKAMQSESYLKAVENIARRARYNAHKRGAKRIALRDVETAIAEVMPAPAATVAARPLQRDRSHAARRLKTPVRSVSTAGQTERISSISGHRNTTPIEEDREVAAAG